MTLATRWMLADNMNSLAKKGRPVQRVTLHCQTRGGMTGCPCQLVYLEYPHGLPLHENGYCISKTSSSQYDFEKSLCYTQSTPDLNGHWRLPALRWDKPESDPQIASEIDAWAEDFLAALKEIPDTNLP